MSSFIKDVSKVGISKIAIIIFSIGRSIITARWLGPEINGTIAALAVYPSLFMTFGSLGISQSATYFIGKGKYTEQSIKTGIFQIWIFTTILSLLVCFCLIRYFSNSGKDLFLVALAITPIPFTLFNTYNSGIFLGKSQIGAFNKINWIPSAFIFLFTVLLVTILPMDISGAMLASITGPLIMFFILLFRNRFIEAFSFRFDWNIIKSLFSLGIVYALAYLIINLNYKSGIVLLDKLSTPYELGIYSKGENITEYLWQIPMLLSTVVFSRSASSKNALEFSKKVARLLRLSIIAVGLGSIVLVILARYIVLILFGNSFIESTDVLRILIPGVLLLTFFKVLNMDLAGKGKPWVSLKAMVPALLLNIVMNFLFIPEYGALGAATSSTLSYSFAALLFLYFYSKETGLSVKEILSFSINDFQIVIKGIKNFLNIQK